MKKAPLPVNEEQRLSVLENYDILDTLPEQDFDDLTLIASQICNTPIALISLLDDHRQWFKSKTGLDVSETSKDIAFCAHAILQDEVFIINDAFKDERFHDNPLATAAPHVRFYAGAPLIAPGGEKIGTLCVIDDHAREITVEQQHALVALSRQVMSQLELRAANKKALKAVKEKSLFLANMSHEIRTPMNAVISCTQLLLDNIKDKKNMQLLKMIDNAGETLLTLINDILDFSKIESGKIILEQRAFDLHECTSSLVSLLSNRSLDRELELSLTIDDTVPVWVSGDITRYRQIVINIIGNAIKFTKDQVLVSLSTKQQAGQEMVLVKIEDNGIGISAHDQQNIFKKFGQLDASTTRKYGGTGLGLSICCGLTTAMKGQIWVESETGKGAAFFVLLPLSSAAPADKNEKIRLSEIDPLMGQQHPLSILLAEDDEVNQIIINQLFEKLHYNIDLVANGQQAVEAAAKNDYDFIFMDMQMPVLDGISATMKIRKLEIKQPVIIALTANAFAEDKEACLQAGMNSFLTKPIQLTQVASEISHFIRYK
ncbi:MAG: ATP-binding protein [Gammaproteobacteria bacterium]|nr:ATP-binding protein [Gammaproteobacteria bacterium]